ncbi:MAG: VCBS repeat-containing protein [Candidatus Omnitrophica bacterium]|nr:VCBS repeat-containing protein [Candidatus Omnitrophota bacterium]
MRTIEIDGMPYKTEVLVCRKDIDRDGIIDAWCCDPGDTVMRIFYGNNDGRVFKRQSIGGVPAWSKGAFHDVDGDGDLDIVLKIEEPGRFTCFAWIPLGKTDVPE